MPGRLLRWRTASGWFGTSEYDLSYAIFIHLQAIEELSRAITANLLQKPKDNRGRAAIG